MTLRSVPVALASLALAGCATVAPQPRPQPMMAKVELTSPPGDAPAEVVLRAPTPVAALHFPTALGSYRAQDWMLTDSGLRWVAKGAGERLERSDGRPIREVRFSVAQRYRALVKSYGPFSPFSDGGLLIYSGHFHACLSLPCDGGGAVAMTISAPGRTIRGRDAVGRDRLRLVSRGEGLNIYVGTRAPQTENAISAIIDPGLPESLRAQLARSLPESMAYFTRAYRPLSFTPQLFASIDARGRADGRESTQGGTLPGQIFMHFDGARARERAAEGDPAWLEWFFAHEVAHMFQRDRSGDSLGHDEAAWMHEGGADAMAALALRARGQTAYVAKRVESAIAECRTALARGPLMTATQRGDFDMHYTCGLAATLALDGALRARGSGLDAFNRRWFAALASGQAAEPDLWFEQAERSGVTSGTVRMLRDLAGGDTAAARRAIDALAPVAG